MPELSTINTTTAPSRAKLPGMRDCSGALYSKPRSRALGVEGWLRRSVAEAMMHLDDEPEMAGQAPFAARSLIPATRMRYGTKVLITKLTTNNTVSTAGADSLLIGAMEARNYR